MWTHLALSLLCVATLVAGHGYLYDPPGRSTMWRRGYNTPKNYNDNQLFCGGAYNQNGINGGKCGICGDPWQGPRDNEAGGRYATGIISEHYKTGQSLTIAIMITANHVGWFEFKICPNNDVTKAATQECLDAHVLQLADGSGTKYHINTNTGFFHIDVRLPPGLTCTQCVLQWRWHTGNSWGVDPMTGRGGLGYGPQEEFYGCSDVAISNDGNPVATQRPPQPVTTPVVPPFVNPFRPITTRVPPFIYPVQPTTTRVPPFINPVQPITTRVPPFIFPIKQTTTPRPIEHETTKSPEQTMPVQIQTGKTCFGVNNWAGIPSLDRWCTLQCNTGECSPLYCRCI